MTVEAPNYHSGDPTPGHAHDAPSDGAWVGWVPAPNPASIREEDESVD
jgi:hypothetical protein